MGGVVPFGVVACVQEVAVTPGELPAGADLIHYTTGASEKDEDEATDDATDEADWRAGAYQQFLRDDSAEDAIYDSLR